MKGRSRFWIGCGIAAVIWLITVAIFFSRALLPAPDPQAIGGNAQSVVIGYEAEQALGDHEFSVFDPNGGGVVLGYDRVAGVVPDSEATWNLNTHTIARLVANSTSSVSVLAICQWSAPNPRDFTPGGSVDVWVDGTRRWHVPLTVLTNDPTAVPPHYYTPASLDQEHIPFDWAYAPMCVRVPLTHADVANDVLPVRLETHARALWYVDTVDVYTQYVPKNSPLFANGLVAFVLGSVSLGLLLAAVFLALRASRRYGGWLGLLLGVATMLLAAVTKAPWDLDVWTLLTNVVAFGGGSPVYAWTGTALWAFLPGVLAPLVAFCNLLFGHAPQIVAVVAIKIAAWAALVSVAAMLARFAPERWRRLIFTIWLVSPFGLFLIAWGVRDVFSSALVLLAITLCLERRSVVAAVLLAAAVSIDEYFAPMMLLPALTYWLTGDRTSKRAATAVGLALLPVALVVFQWVAVGHAYAGSVLKFRLAWSVRENTWQYLASLFGLVPGWFTAHPALSFFVLYVLIALAFIIMLVQLTVGKRQWSTQEAVYAVLTPLTGCVGAFFLSYGQSDAQEWFGFFVLLQLVALRKPRLAAMPVALLFFAGIYLYAHVGLHLFLDPAFFLSWYGGIWGTSGAIDRMLTGTVLALIAVSLWLLARGTDERAWGPLSAPLLVLWFASLMSVAWGTNMQAIDMVVDLVLIGSAFVLFVTAVSALGDRPGGYSRRRRSQLLVMVTLVVLAAVAPLKWWAFALAGACVLCTVALPQARQWMRDVCPTDWIMLFSALVFQLAPSEDRLNIVNLGSAGAVVWVVLVCAVFVIALAASAFGRDWLARLRYIPDEDNLSHGTAV